MNRLADDDPEEYLRLKAEADEAWATRDWNVWGDR
jgi:hypothetical protein